MHPGDVAPHGSAAADDVPGHLLTSGTWADVYALDDERVLRRYREARDAMPEVELLRHVRAHDFPAPDVLDAHGSDIVMNRLHGPTLLQALGAAEITLADAAQVHLDLHPGNVVLTEHGPTLVDWANARAGHAELDVAVTALLIAEVAVDAGGDYSSAARALLAAFLHASHVSPRDAIDDAAGLRSVTPGLLPGERELVPQGAALVRSLLDLTGS